MRLNRISENDKPKPPIQPPDPKPKKPAHTEIPPAPVQEPPFETKIIPEIDPNMPTENPSRDPRTPPTDIGMKFL